MTPEEVQRDTELVRRFNAGDEKAFVEIVERHRERMFTAAMSVLRNPHDAEEIAAEVFIKAHRALARFRGDSALHTWLYRIALNLARNRYWYYHRRKRNDMCSIDRPLGDDTGDTYNDILPSEAPGPADEYVLGEMTGILTRAIDKLPQAQREILTQRALLHRPYEEIAVTLGINVGTVKSRLARARDRLREVVAEECAATAEAARRVA